jgi:hypothetical protein
MPEYIFYPTNTVGLAVSLAEAILSSDEAAIELAARLCHDHPSCSLVAVWQGERLVDCYRPEAPI